MMYKDIWITIEIVELEEKNLTWLVHKHLMSRHILQIQFRRLIFLLCFSFIFKLSQHDFDFAAFFFLYLNILGWNMLDFA